MRTLEFLWGALALALALLLAQAQVLATTPSPSSKSPTVPTPSPTTGSPTVPTPSPTTGAPTQPYQGGSDVAFAVAMAFVGFAAFAVVVLLANGLKSIFGYKSVRGG